MFIQPKQVWNKNNKKAIVTVYAFVLSRYNYHFYKIFDLTLSSKKYVSIPH